MDWLVNLAGSCFKLSFGHSLKRFVADFLA
jgi:hypothetical protein